MAAYHESAKTSILKLNSNNYHQWKFGIEMVLLKENLLEVVTGERPDEITESWKKSDNSARASIALSVEVELHPLIMETRSAKEMWTKLKNHFERTSYSSRIFLKRKLYNTKLEGNKMEEYINKITRLTQILRAGGTRVDDEDVISIILCGLNESYDSLIMAIEGRDEKTLNLEMIKMKLIDESMRRDEKLENNINPQAMITSQRRENRNTYKTEKICYECRQPGHIRYYCPRLKRSSEVRPSRESNFLSFEGKETETSIEEQRVNKPTDTRNEESNYCNFSQTQKSKGEYERFYAYVSLDKDGEIIKTNDDEWVLDSGATAHMTYNKELFQEFSVFQHPTEVIFANGTISTAMGSGTISIKTNKGSECDRTTFNKVLYVPDMFVNLLSVPVLSMEGHKITFEGETCTITSMNEEILSGSIRDGVFIAKPITQLERGFSACVHMWHQRLGHRSIEKIKKMSNSNEVKNLKISKCHHSDFCKTCQLSGMKQKQFRGITSCQSNKPFQLIHMDLCGPIRPTSKGGSNYFLTMTDDHTRYCQVEILRNKFQASEYIKDFLESSRNKFGYYPLAIRSDNGGEFENHELNRYLRDKGINHQLSVPYQPQENGIAERINFTLVTMAKCILTDKKLPKNLWGEAIISACYIYNRMEHSFTNKIPLFMWEGKIVDFDNMKTIGSQCFAYQPKQNRAKLENNSIEAILIGYCRRQKGYRLLNAANDQIIISNNIKCNEVLEEPRIEVKKLEEPVADDTIVPNGEIKSETIGEIEPMGEPLRRSTRDNFGKTPRRYLE